MFLVVLLSGCTSSELIIKPDLTHVILLNEFTPVDKSELTVNNFPLPQFEPDLVYLKETLPPDVLKSVEDNSASVWDVLYNGKYIFYIVSYDVMRGTGTTYYKIFRSPIDDLHSCEELYISKDKREKEILSAVVNDEYFFLTENILTNEPLDVKPHYTIKKLDLNTFEVTDIWNSDETESFIIPILSLSDSMVYWYTSLGDTFNICLYDFVSDKLDLLATNVVLNNPYTAYCTTESNIICYLSQSGIIYEMNAEKCTLSLSETDNVIYVTASKQYILWVTIPERSNYSRKTIYLYDMISGKTYQYNDVDGRIAGYGFIENYVYLNDSVNGIGFYNLKDSSVYTSPGQFHWPEISPTGELSARTGDYLSVFG
jgi:hypothetical protein